MTGVVLVSNGCRGGGGGGGKRSKGEEERENQLSLIALLLAALRRSMVSCSMERRAEEDAAPALRNLEIGWPTEVRHVAHVTFDRFNGFLGLPVEFELEIPCRAPSASVSVFGVSAESMQCCYDPKGNSVPTILLLMQERLYLQGGLKAEGIFRINPENGQEEHVREQLNKGIVPDDIDVHCLAGLIKAWFRELPEGVLDCLSPEQVLHCNTEDECVELVKRLLPTQAALLNWAVDLMADVVEEEETSKMNARNIAMVFAPNMTRMSDPLTALIHAVQVMNLLKTLILKTLSEREEATTGGGGGHSPFSSSRSSDQQGADETDDQQDVTSESREIDSDDERDGYGQQEVDTSGELRRDISDGCGVNYISEGEDDLDKQIEECFLRQLELKGQTDGDLGGDHTSQGFCLADQATQLACSDSNESNLWSFLSMAESKRRSSSTIEETCSEASVTRDAVISTKTASKPIEDGQGVQMLVSVTRSTL